MSDFIVSIKRDARKRVTKNWKAELKLLVPELQNGASPWRAQVSVPDEALDKIRRQLGEDFRIEPVIVHHVS